MYAVKQNTKKADLYITEATNIDYKITKSLNIKDIVTKERAEEIQKLVKEEFGVGSKVIELELVEKGTQNKYDDENLEKSNNLEEAVIENKTFDEDDDKLTNSDIEEEMLANNELDLPGLDASDFEPTPEPTPIEEVAVANTGFTKAWG